MLLQDIDLTLVDNYNGINNRFVKTRNQGGIVCPGACPHATELVKKTITQIPFITA